MVPIPEPEFRPETGFSSEGLNSSLAPRETEARPGARELSTSIQEADHCPCRRQLLADIEESHFKNQIKLIIKLLLIHDDETCRSYFVHETL